MVEVSIVALTVEKNDLRVYLKKDYAKWQLLSFAIELNDESLDDIVMKKFSSFFTFTDVVFKQFRTYGILAGKINIIYYCTIPEAKISLAKSYENMYWVSMREPPLMMIDNHRQILLELKSHYNFNFTQMIR